MKKVLLFLLITSTGLFGVMNKEQIKMAVSQHILDSSSVQLSGSAAVLMDEKTGNILFSKNAHDQLYPASTTKLLTALVVLDKSSHDEQVNVGKEVWINTGGEARVGLFEGQVQTVEELLAALLLQSGNDAARTLAVFIAEKENGGPLPTEVAIANFARLMNEKASEVGATSSHFINPHGLHDPEHYSTAYDLAVIAKTARQNDVIKNIISQPSYSTKTHVYSNRNKLLDRGNSYYFDGATGMKTGFTDEAGYCLVTSAERGGKQLIAVVMNSGQDSIWNDSISLLHYGFGR